MQTAQNILQVDVLNRPITNRSILITRKTLAGLALASALAGLTGCIDRQSPVGFAIETSPSRQLNYPIESYKLMYAGVREQSYRVPPVPYQRMNPDYLRQIVHNPTVEPPGTIVIDEQTHYLYLILADRKAVRYGIAIGTAYRHWSGPCSIAHREPWPAWSSQVRTERKSGWLTQGPKKMQPGLHNPYGSRAMHIYQGGTNTELVIHGTSSWHDIGGPAPQGSIVMLNQDVMDLYHRTHSGTRVVILKR